MDPRHVEQLLHRARVLNATNEDQRRDRRVGLFEKLDPKSEGSGAGLALTKRVVELHNSRIWFELEGPKQGSIFYVTLPGAKSENEGTTI